MKNKCAGLVRQKKLKAVDIGHTCKAQLAGFTLAEVLITLMVIGIVSSMTIPALMNNIGKAQYKAGHKKSMSAVTQALMLAAAERGGTLAGYSNETGTSDARANDFKDMVLPYFRTINNCNINEGNDVGSSCKLNTSEVYNYNGEAYNIESWNWNENNKASIVLHDGSMLYFLNRNENMGSCTNDRISGGNYQNKACGFVAIDINGKKEPNKATYDIWEYHIAFNGNLIPFGSEFDLFKGSYSASHGYTAAYEDMFLKKVGWAVRTNHCPCVIRTLHYC